ncbi:hypothetical protein BpHYR1_050977 [Brachionus plicatilis]|uniref:Uncharacterized protein n=1 Tax=Brachionus plicatilis TaxID=10195 RepID=A0A3M7QYF2_BRAPC|nr:hypothetical protein BpHYR1_050977 [Brachionus plicatilis]
MVPTILNAQKITTCKSNYISNQTLIKKKNLLKALYLQKYYKDKISIRAIDFFRLLYFRSFEVYFDRSKSSTKYHAISFILQAIEKCSYKLCNTLQING